MPHYILYVVMLGFIYLNSIRSWFGGLKGMLITVVSVLLSVCSNCFEKCTYGFKNIKDDKRIYIIYKIIYILLIHGNWTTFSPHVIIGAKNRLMFSTDFRTI